MGAIIPEWWATSSGISISQEELAHAYGSSTIQIERFSGIRWLAATRKRDAHLLAQKQLELQNAAPVAAEEA
ncbi:hypothetical protein ACFFWD_37425 [Bradyrhizobium erythrophlei]|uniref:hypothetical protein n=1 Tax=Bradyrhizobium erythrophlei TaxID=1437360 RepID=UPI0035EE85C7